MLALSATFASEVWTAGRVVTDLCWSPAHRELLLASYSVPVSSAASGGATSVSAAPSSTGAPGSSPPPDGLIMVWSKHLTTRPEVILRAPTAILCALFAPHHPNLVVGAGHSGQIFLWDLREPRSPVLQTPLSGMAHSHPVLSMSMIGSPASASLVTLSDDGRLCSWTLDQLAQPQETLDLVHPVAEGADVEEVAVACAAFQPAETAALWVGEEGGMLYRVDRYDQATSKAGVLHQPLEGGHESLVTALHFHPMERYKHLLLSCSADWTIKLWDAKVCVRELDLSRLPVYRSIFLTRPPPYTRNTPTTSISGRGRWCARCRPWSTGRGTCWMCAGPHATRPCLRPWTGRASCMCTTCCRMMRWVGRAPSPL
jgi:dynein intermediate chain